ncbi:glycosyltransferase [Chitinophagaceae bacterium MMS25-I14]
MNKKQDTLIILSPAFAAYEGDVWLPSQSELIRTLNRLYPSLNIIILAFHYPVSATKEHSWYGNRVITFGAGMKGGFRSPLLWLRVWRCLKQLKKQCNFIGLFSFFCSESAFVGHYFARFNKLKHYIWVMGLDAQKNNKQVRRIHPSADELVCISDFLQEEFERSHGIRPAHVIPIGIDTRLFSDETPERIIDLLGVGSLSPLKQYDVFIEVVKEVQAQLPGVSAMICGDGSEREILQQQIRAAGLEEHISMAGAKPHEETLHQMQKSKILLHPSRYEGFGMVNAEALYAGAHVISFVKPMHAAIPHWHIVQTKEEMAQKAIELLTNERTEYRNIVTYTMEDSAKRIRELYGKQ